MSRVIRVTCVFFLLVASCMAQQKKRIAVLDFDYGTVRSYVMAIWGTDQDVGKGVALKMEERLFKDGKYSLVDRKALDKILAEQDFANSDRADPATAAKIGKVLGVDAIIVGSITQFGRDDKSKGIAGGGLIPGKFGALGGIKKNEFKAVCAITAKMVDASTGEILAMATGKGESKRSAAALGGIGGGSGGVGGAKVDMGSSNFDNTILGEAVNECVGSTATQIDSAAGNIPTQKANVSGLVADVSGNTLILNVGSKAGLRVGDTLDILRSVRTVKDPSTGKVLKTISNNVGVATVTEVDADSATASFSGGAPAKVGDLCKSQK